MADHIQTAIEYRKRAAEVRVMAQAMRPKEHQAGLISIAESYERLAQLADKEAERARRGAR